MLPHHKLIVHQTALVLGSRAEVLSEEQPIVASTKFPTKGPDQCPNYSDKSVIRQGRTNHSCRKASTGSILAARRAGYSPKMIPTNPEIVKAMIGDQNVTIVLMFAK